MNRMTYPHFIWKTHRGLIVFSVLFTAALQFLIIFLITSVDTAPIFDAIAKQLPARLRILFNEQFMNRLSVKGAAAFGFNHPLVIALFGIIATVIPARHIAGEVESGTLELLLSYPVRRRTLLFSLWSSTATFLLFVIAGALAGSVSALLIFHFFNAEVFGGLVQIAANLWLLAVAIMSYTLLMSVFWKEAGKTGTRSAAVTLSFYFIYFISTLWDFIAFLKPVNIFNYYQPQKLMFGQQSFLKDAVVLGALIIIFAILAFRQFERRDIP